MNRLVYCLAACLVLSLVACGDDDERVTISLFKAAPDAIEVGQPTKLLFAVDPADAKVTIDGLGDFTGKTEASVNPTANTTYHLTATKGDSSAQGDATVMVGPQTATGLKVEPASNTSTAGQSLDVTLTAVTAAGKPAPGFKGTVHLSSTDAQAVFPAEVTFAAADNGVKRVTVTLKTAGLSTLTGTNTANPGMQGSASVTVAAASAVNCAAGQAPVSAVAGSVIGVAVVVHDAFGNVATGYTGTVRLTATDLRATLPPDVTYAALDAGNHAFSAELITTGPQTLSAADLTDPNIHCNAAVTVIPAAPKLRLTLPDDANAGYAVNVGVLVRDLFDNAIPNYAGTLTFTSTDTGAGAVTPAALTFTGSEGGAGTTSATFVTLGTQILSASDGGTPVAAGNVASRVHGLVYTAPTSGRVRLVANAAQSNTRVVQLDLVANERLEMSSFFTVGGLLGGPGSFAAGMNLPLDTTRIMADANLFIPGAALPVGTGTRAAGGVIGATDHVLYTAVSRKRTSATNFRQATEVQAGGVFYSVRLQLTPTGTAGPVFDGAQPSPLFRAAVRDQFGDDFVSQNDIGIGKLEVR